MGKVKLTDEQIDMAAGLTKLKRNVVLAMVEDPKLSQRQAYYIAGGTAKTDESADAAVSKMLSDSKVLAFRRSLLETATTSSVMTRTEALEGLSRIANGTTRDTGDLDGCKVGISAISQLSKMEGWDAPKKTELTGKDGEAIEVADVTPTEMARKIAFLLSQGVDKS